MQVLTLALDRNRLRAPYLTSELEPTAPSTARMRSSGARRRARRLSRWGWAAGTIPGLRMSFRHPSQPLTLELQPSSEAHDGPCETQGPVVIFAHCHCEERRLLIEHTNSMLAGKVAIITGSSSGLGRAIALAYTNHGANVVCADRSALGSATSQSTHALIRAKGGRSVFVKTDVTSADSVRQLIDNAVGEYGRVDM